MLHDPNYLCYTRRLGDWETRKLGGLLYPYHYPLATPTTLSQHRSHEVCKPQVVHVRPCQNRRAYHHSGI